MNIQKFIPINSSQFDERTRRLKRIISEYYPSLETASLNFKDCTAVVFGFENYHSLSKKIADNNKLEVKPRLSLYDEALSSTAIKTRRSLQTKRLIDYAKRIGLPGLAYKAAELIEHWKPSAERQQHTTYGTDELEAFARSGVHYKKYESLGKLVDLIGRRDRHSRDMNRYYNDIKRIDAQLERQLRKVSVSQFRSWHKGLKVAVHIGDKQLVNNYFCDLAIVAIRICTLDAELLSKSKVLLEMADEYQELTALKSTLAGTLLRLAVKVDSPNERLAYLRRALSLCKAVDKVCKENGTASVFREDDNLIEFYQNSAYLNWELREDEAGSVDDAVLYYNESEKIRKTIVDGKRHYISDQWARELERIGSESKEGDYHE